MKWERIKPFGPDAYTHWVSSIYEIVSYRRGEYHAFFMPDHYQNWGDYVYLPPDINNYGNPRWRTLKAAKAACERHKETHVPKPKTIRRAKELLEHFRHQQEENNT